MNQITWKKSVFDRDFRCACGKKLFVNGEIIYPNVTLNPMSDGGGIGIYCNTCGDLTAFWNDYDTTTDFENVSRIVQQAKNADLYHKEMEKLRKMVEQAMETAKIQTRDYEELANKMAREIDERDETIREYQLKIERLEERDFLLKDKLRLMGVQYDI